MSIEVKICGLMDAKAVTACIESKAAYIGFVFHAPSPRCLASITEAVALAELVPSSMKRVGLFVDASDDEIRAVLKYVPLDILQLHGHETPGRVMAVRDLTGLPIMKALRVATAEDLKPVTVFEAVVDRLLFDTKIGEEPTGGTGKSFDWNLLKGRRLPKPWMLAGGLNAANLAEAVLISGAKTVDVSSGVEDASGQKNPDKIREFIHAAAAIA